MAVAALGEAFAAILGLAFGGPAAPVLIPALSPFTTRWMERAAAEWTRKSEVVADAALEASGLSDPEEFCDILYGDPELIALAQKIVWAASISGNSRKLQTLGAFLGGAVASRGDRLDETQLLVSALADIEASHAVVLDILTRPAPDDEKYSRKHAEDIEAARAKAANPSSFTIPPHRDGGEVMAYEPGAWLPEQIQEHLPMAPGFVFACLSVLTRHSLAATLATYEGGTRFKITDFGRALVEVMNQVTGRTERDPNPEPSDP
jgi:hypothetical protein